LDFERYDQRCPITHTTRASHVRPALVRHTHDTCQILPRPNSSPYVASPAVTVPYTQAHQRSSLVDDVVCVMTARTVCCCQTPTCQVYALQHSNMMRQYATLTTSAPTTAVKYRSPRLNRHDHRLLPSTSRQTSLTVTNLQSGPDHTHTLPTGL